MKTISKIAAIALVAAFVVGASVSPVKAATVAELQAMIASLSAQIAALSGTPSTPAAVTFTSNLTVGSTGAEVTALQNFLIGKGYKTLATGYFGPMTKAALAAYQTAKGITPAAGYFGPLTRASVNGEAAVTTTTTTTTTGVTTTGKEGSISVTNTATGLASTAYEGDSKVAVLAFKVEAKNSDVSVQRVKIDFGTTTTTIQNKIYSKFYVMDGSTVLAEVDSSEASKDSSNSDKYALQITGFNYLVKMDETKTLTIKADVYGTVDSTKLGTYTLALSTNGVRAVDGAGIDQTAGGAAVTRGVQIKKDIAESASIVLSTNSSTPDATQVIASEGSDSNEKDGVTLLTFNLQAKKDSVTVTDLTVAAAESVNGGAALQTVYLYDGSTQLDSATLSGGQAVFSNLDVAIAKDATKSLTVKADVRSADTSASTWSATTTATYITAENSKGDSVTDISGSATGNAVTFLSTGPEFTVVSKSVAKDTVTDSGVSTSTLTATFKINVKAVGGAITLGSVASGTKAFAIGTSTGARIYKNGAYDNSLVVAAVSYAKPSTGVTEASDTYTISEGNSAEFTVNYKYALSGSSSINDYAVQIAGINVSGVTSTFMNALDGWRSDARPLP
jgi:peptidoglycan hydrolase-like protein with peptidoglycan-binding domain